MGFVRRVGVFLIVLGVLAVVAGFVLSVAPGFVERVATAPNTRVVLDDRFTVGPLEYSYVTFTVPEAARSAFLDVELTVYRGNDIDLEIYRWESKVYERRVSGGFTGTITLIGPGSYEVRFDNTYSILTSKDVGARLVLRWSELGIERHELASQGRSLMVGGLLLTLAGAIAYTAGRTAAKA